MDVIQPRLFNDPIHGSVELPPLLVKIIDTPQFQRLRNIKQLGGKSYVYPGANHTRFEHSIGVAYLAGELVKALRERQPELKITKTDVLCVQIAGLCHDLGHGPFSHLYDGMFIPLMQRRLNVQGNLWKHETASEEMFKHMVKENKLDEEMKKDPEFIKELNSPDISDDMLKEKVKKDLEFIKELINPKNSNGLSDEEQKKWPFIGRGEDKSFLYDIVFNKRNGIDVDKWDYFARDCHYLGMKNSFDYRRLILSARVCKPENGWREICFRDKEVFNLYDMFYTRYSLYRRAYQHKTGRIIERMTTEAFVKANEYIQIQGSGGQTFNLFTAKDDMEAYTKLTDNVFEEILHYPSYDQNIIEAKEILGRILKRDHYKCLGEFPSQRSKDEIKKIKAQCEKELGQNIPPGGTQNVQPRDFVVDKIKLNYGNGKNNPMERVHFYQKSDPNKAIKLKKEDVSFLLPAEFEETIIMIIIIIPGKKTDDETLERGRQYFKKFKSIHDNFAEPQPAE